MHTESNTKSYLSEQVIDAEWHFHDFQDKLAAWSLLAQR